MEQNILMNVLMDQCDPYLRKTYYRVVTKSSLLIYEHEFFQMTIFFSFQSLNKLLYIVKINIHPLEIKNQSH